MNISVTGSPGCKMFVLWRGYFVLLCSGVLVMHTAANACKDCINTLVGYQSTLKVQCSYDLITLEWSRVVYPAEEGYFIYYTCENQAGNKTGSNCSRVFVTKYSFSPPMDSVNCSITLCYHTIYFTLEQTQQHCLFSPPDIQPDVTTHLLPSSTYNLSSSLIVTSSLLAVSSPVPTSSLQMMSSPAPIPTALPNVMFNVDVLSQHEFAVIWNLPVELTGLVTHFIIIVTSTSTIVFNETIPVAVNKRDYNITVSNLDPFIPYLIEVTAVNEIADITSEISEVTVFTQQGRPSMPPSNIRVYRLTGTSIQVLWEPLTLIQARGFINRYVITLSPVTKVRDTQVVIVPGNRSEVIINDLNPELEYQIVLSVATEEGSSEPSNITLSQNTQIIHLCFNIIESSTETFISANNLLIITDSIISDCLCNLDNNQLTITQLNCSTYECGPKLEYKARLMMPNETALEEALISLRKCLSRSAAYIIELDGVIIQLDSNCSDINMSDEVHIEPEDSDLDITSDNILMISLGVFIAIAIMILCIATFLFVMVSRKKKDRDFPEGLDIVLDPFQKDAVQSKIMLAKKRLNIKEHKRKYKYSENGYETSGGPFTGEEYGSDFIMNTDEYAISGAQFTGEEGEEYGSDFIINTDEYEISGAQFTGEQGEEYGSDVTDVYETSGAQFTEEEGEEYGSYVTDGYETSGAQFTGEEGEKYSSDVTDVYETSGAQFTEEEGEEYGSDVTHGYETSGAQFTEEGEEYGSDVTDGYETSRAQFTGEGEEYGSDVTDGYETSGARFTGEGEKYSSDVTDVYETSGAQFTGEEGEEYGSDVTDGYETSEFHLKPQEEEKRNITVVTSQ